ncbi:hypothetical protein [Paraclostridium bifermentans]|uniref:hypothetical protein n=1 Tax=Paraclostridium bifermentans TaxID=1490 RepID=UPI001D01617E|nr:hypothetical protein [Paraclostridium bifermentans]
MTNKVDINMEDIMNNENEFKKFINSIKHNEDVTKEVFNIILKHLYENHPKTAIDLLFKAGYIKEDLVKITDNQFYGLRASFNVNINSLKCDEDVIEIIEKILDLDIKPSRVFVKHDKLDIFYQPQNEINIKNQSEYMNLINNFIDFIEYQDSVKMKFSGWNLNGENVVESEANDSNTLFSKEIFNPNIVYVDGLLEGYITL